MSSENFCFDDAAVFFADQLVLADEATNENDRIEHLKMADAFLFAGNGSQAVGRIHTKVFYFLCNQDPNDKSEALELLRHIWREVEALYLDIDVDECPEFNVSDQT